MHTKRCKLKQAIFTVYLEKCNLYIYIYIKLKLSERQVDTYHFQIRVMTEEREQLKSWVYRVSISGHFPGNQGPDWLAHDLRSLKLLSTHWERVNFQPPPRGSRFRDLAVADPLCVSELGWPVAVNGEGNSSLQRENSREEGETERWDQPSHVVISH